MKQLELHNWELLYDNRRIKAQVPGDITIDLKHAGVIGDPYYDLNHKDVEWIPRQDFTYVTEILADDEMLKEESVQLVFEGIDLFAEIYLNDHLLGKTENMFLEYAYEIKPLLQNGANQLRVEMKSTIKAIEEGEDSSNYISIFNRERFFVRKAQCHFGWDWAPNMCGYGIWGKVFLNIGSKYRIKNTHYKTDTKGNVTLFAEMNYNLMNVYAPGSIVAITGAEKQDDKVVFSISETPFGEPCLTKEVALEGSKCFVNFSLEDVHLWWPVGYGEQPLYNYKVELYRNGALCDSYSGRLAFRTVKVIEEPKGDYQLNHMLCVNDVEVFMKGSNWVPMECFTGIVKHEQYERFIDRAIEANFNMLRIWGGGIYETEDFYNLCDEKGMMVWQDLMVACQDVPDDHPEWVENFLKEVEYQVCRLRVHPSLVYWSGGNEKPGSFALETSKGDFMINYTLPGYVNYYDNTRPYYRQSPCSYTDVGNDPSNGDCHWGNFERCITDGVDGYRSYISDKIAPLASECAVLGPCSVESFEKFLAPEHLWPMNEVWVDRLMENSSSWVKMNFSERELFYAEQFYGPVKNLKDFVAKGMQVHAESIRAELEIMRAHKGLCSGFMNWMYNDIWPQATWAVVDYYGEPKQVYYQMKRSFEPVLSTFFEAKDGHTYLAVVNDLTTSYSADVRYGVKTFDGQIVYQDTLEVKKLTNAAVRKKVDFDCTRKDIYLFVEYLVDGEKRKTLYSPHFWRHVDFQSDYEVQLEQITDCLVKVHVKANAFAKSVFISHENNCDFTYSDNYVDIEAGDEVEILVSSKQPFDKEELCITDFAMCTKEIR